MANDRARPADATPQPARLMLYSQEHYDLMSQFEREHTGHRLTREPKALWALGIVYQDGEVNGLFLSYRRGYAFGKAVWQPAAAPLASSPRAEPKQPFRITVDKDRFYDALMALPDAPDIGGAGALVTCDCATTPPTMPTYRSEHLATCPVAQWQATHPSPPAPLGEAPLASAPSDRWHSLQYTETDYQRDIEELEARLAAVESSLQSERLARETAEQERTRLNPIRLQQLANWLRHVADRKLLWDPEWQVQMRREADYVESLVAPHPETRP